MAFLSTQSCVHLTTHLVIIITSRSICHVYCLTYMHARPHWATCPARLHLWLIKLWGDFILLMELPLSLPGSGYWFSTWYGVQQCYVLTAHTNDSGPAVWLSSASCSLYLLRVDNVWLELHMLLEAPLLKCFILTGAEWTDRSTGSKRKVQFK